MYCYQVRSLIIIISLSTSKCCQDSFLNLVPFNMSLPSVLLSSQFSRICHCQVYCYQVSSLEYVTAKCIVIKSVPSNMSLPSVLLLSQFPQICHCQVYCYQVSPLEYVTAKCVFSSQIPHNHYITVKKSMCKVSFHKSVSSNM